MASRYGALRLEFQTRLWQIIQEHFSEVKGSPEFMVTPRGPNRERIIARFHFELEVKAVPRVLASLEEVQAGQEGICSLKMNYYLEDTKRSNQLLESLSRKLTMLQGELQLEFCRLTAKVGAELESLPELNRLLDKSSKNELSVSLKGHRAEHVLSVLLQDSMRGMYGLACCRGGGRVFHVLKVVPGRRPVHEPQSYEDDMEPGFFVPYWLWLELRGAELIVYLHDPQYLGRLDLSSEYKMEFLEQAIQRATDQCRMGQLYEQMKDSFECPVDDRQMLFFSKEAAEPRQVRQVRSQPKAAGQSKKAMSRLEMKQMKLEQQNKEKAEPSLED
jgi:hypothetical protein